jgi:hypothetical protein
MYKIFLVILLAGSFVFAAKAGDKYSCTVANNMREAIKMADSCSNPSLEATAGDVVIACCKGDEAPELPATAPAPGGGMGGGAAGPGR